MTGSGRIGCAIIGSGNIGTDLMIKILRYSDVLDVKLLVGIDAASDGLGRARSMGIPVTDRGIDGLLEDAALLESINIVFDATSAKAHERHAPLLREKGIRSIDLTPAAIGPFIVPTVNLGEMLDESNVNLITCGGQATIPLMHAISRVTPVHYGEMVSSIASRSAGPGTRANIDEFTRTTAMGLERVGGARRGKAIIILNPAEPPLIMRNTVYAIVDDVDEDAVSRSVEEMVEAVQAYVPGYRLKAGPLFESLRDRSMTIPGLGTFTGTKISVFLEVEGAAHYLPAYAGNLDIMTAAARRTGEVVARHLQTTGSGGTHA